MESTLLHIAGACAVLVSDRRLRAQQPGIHDAPGHLRLQEHGAHVESLIGTTLFQALINAEAALMRLGSIAGWLMPTSAVLRHLICSDLLCGTDK